MGELGKVYKEATFGLDFEKWRTLRELQEPWPRAVKGLRLNNQETGKFCI